MGCGASKSASAPIVEPTVASAAEAELSLDAQPPGSLLRALCDNEMQAGAEAGERGGATPRPTPSPCPTRSCGTAALAAPAPPSLPTAPTLPLHLH